MARNKVSLYYIYKATSSEIINNNFQIDTTFKDAKNSGRIIAIGDNQVLKFIRRLKDQEDNSLQIKELKSKKKTLLQANPCNPREIQTTQNQINDLMFVPDLVSVKTDTTKKDYKAICKNHFSITIEINGHTYYLRYKRLCAGAGQLRRNSALFVNENLYDMLEQIMLCGLTRSKIGKINLAKFSAYYALYTSATNVVTTPRICVIPDFEYDLKDQTVDWIYNHEDGTPDIKTEVIDFKINAFDGSGMISPAMARIWQEDLHLDYLPSSFITRAPWHKGLVSVFDFHKFAKEVAHTDKITDIYGTEYDIDNIDAIFTNSQFKMAKYYKNYQEFEYYFHKFGHTFGVTRVNKKYSDFATPLNYQYVQSNNFTEESIKELANPTVRWLDGLLSCDPIYSTILLTGEQHNKTFEELESSLDSPIAKCLLYNQDLLKDSYVKAKVKQSAQKKIDQAKIGKLYVEGSYDFILPDLYAMAEHAFKLPVKGLLPPYSMWSRRWVENKTDKISFQRSPLVAPGENRVLSVFSNERCREWFKYIYWGNVINIWDLTLIAASDADEDGDIILSSNNDILINAINPDLPVITYEKTKAKAQRLNMESFANWDIKSFDSPIGGITNLASNIYAMLPNYEFGSKEYIELEKRIRLLRRSQGDAMDYCCHDAVMFHVKLGEPTNVGCYLLDS